MIRTAATPPSSTRSSGSDRPRDRARARAAPGRYDRLREARVPSDGVARAPGARRADMVVGAVADPYEDGKLRLQVTINRRVDILEEERSHNRISEAAYLTGRQIQAKLERQGHLGAVSWDGTGRGDPEIAREMRHQRIIAATNEIDALRDQVVGRIGMVGWRLICWLVGDRMSFADCAVKHGKPGERGARYVSTRFRDDLEDLAEALAARGKGRPTPEDDHRAAALAAPARQATSMRGGATRRRLEGELAATLEAIPKRPSARERGRLLDQADELVVRLAGYAAVTEADL